MYKILIVDDEKMIRTGISAAFAWETLDIDEVYTAASAHEALEVVKDHHPEIIVSDISMTEMTGLELIEEVRKTDQHCRIIVLTGYDRFDYARQALQLRAQDFLLKPIDEEELSDCIHRQVRELEQERTERNRKAFIRRSQGLKEQIYLEKCLKEFIRNGQEMELKEKLPAEFQPYYANGIRIGVLLPGFSLTEQSKEDYFQQQTIKNVCMSVIDMQKKGITFSDDKERVVIVFFADANGGYSNAEVAQLTDLLESECGVRMRIVLGSEQDSFENLHISYNDAVFTLEREWDAFEAVIHAHGEQKRDSMFRAVFHEFKGALLNNINNIEYFIHVFERFQEAMESYNLSDRDAVRCCFELASSVYFTYVNEIGNSVKQQLDDLMHSLSGVKRETAGKLTLMFIQKLLTKESQTEHELIRKVKKSIQENLSNDLTVANLAAEVYVTPNYLSRLFKRMTGEGCNEYIIGKRIEKAKALLENTTLKAGEIATLVGYHDINYFSMAFKKHNNVSPTKYRSRIQQQKSKSKAECADG